MEEETAEFKMDVSDESIRRKVMKVVYEFPGVTLVDIKDKNIVKVRGSKLAKFEMGCKLRTIDKSVDIINPSQKPQQNYYGVPRIINYLYPTKEDVVIFEFQMLREDIISDAMIVLWEFPGITSVERRGIEQIKVRLGQAQIKLEMVEELQKRIDKTAEIIWHGDGPEAEKWPCVKKQSRNTSSSKVSKVRKPISKEAGGYARQEPEAPQKAKAELQHEPPKKAKVEIPVKHDIIKKKTVNVLKSPEKRSYKRRNKLLRCFCLGC